jgi:membrane-associated phospholipid phosphatase
MLEHPGNAAAEPVGGATREAGDVSPAPDTPAITATPVQVVSPREHVRHPALRLWGGALAFVALLAVLYWAFVLTEAGQRLENVALAGAALRTEPTRADAQTGLGMISETSFAVVILLAAAAAVFRRRLTLAVVIVAAMGGSVVVAELLKGSLPRPGLVEGPAWILRNTFPSGHAAVAAAIGVGLVLAVPARLRWMALPVAAVGAALVGQATIGAGWHRASDAIGGVLLVLGVTCAVLAVLATLGHVLPEAMGQVHPRIHRGLVLVAAVAVAIGAVLGLAAIVVAVSGSRAEAYAGSVHLALVFAAAGVTVLAFDAFGRLVEPLAFGRSGAPARPSAGRAQEPDGGA